MILYGNSTWASPYVLSCFVALREKGLPVEMRLIALDRGEQFAPAFAKAALTARVPALVHEGVTLSESSAIVEYLEDAFPPPAHPRVLPAGIVERARARQVMAWLRSDLMPIREQRSAEYVFYPHAELPPFHPLDESARHAVAKLVAVAESLVPPSAGSMFGAWCIADTDLAMMLQRLIKCGDTVPNRLCDYAEREFERPAIRAYAAEKRPEFHGMATYPAFPLA